jgi:DNA polymerase
VTVLHIDCETRSTVELKKTGAYVYAAHPDTDVWCVAYAFDDGPVHTWFRGGPTPERIAEHVIAGLPLYAHNAAFERAIWKHILRPRYDWPEPEIEQWRCTMVMSYAMALPGSLEQAAPAAGLDIAKDDAGRRLMLQMAKPRKRDPLIWWDDPEKVERLIAYCVQDVEVERALGDRLRPLKESELALWHLDQAVNDRGICVDVELAEAAKKVVAGAQQQLDADMHRATGGHVTTCSNRNQILSWLRAQGMELESLSKDNLAKLLEGDLPQHVREVLDIRRISAKASVAKIDTLLAGTDDDGRARGLLQFHAASTGRWAGRRFQPQNIKRPDLRNVDRAIDMVRSGDIDLVQAFYDEPLSVVGDCLRGMIKAAPGHRIIAADYSNIEGRVLAWLAGEDWKLDAFRAFDAGTGPDLYLVAAAGIYGVEVSTLNSKSPERQIGKVAELALGYQGGVGAFQTMATNYGVNLPNDQVEQIRDKWRAKNSRIKQCWYELEGAATAAVKKPGTLVECGKIKFKVAGSFLFMRLPSGRLLAYAEPTMRYKEMPWKDEDGKPIKKLSLSYMGVNSYTRKWERCFAYGGLLAENATQAVARDVMAAAMPKLEAAGYPIVLTVHDEIVCEVPTGHGQLSGVERIMCDLPAWAEGCPVVAEGFEGERYRK